MRRMQGSLLNQHCPCACVCVSLSLFPSFSLSPSLPYSLSSLSSDFLFLLPTFVPPRLKTLNKSRQEMDRGKKHVSEAFEVFHLLVLYFSFAEKCHLHPRNSFKRSRKQLTSARQCPWLHRAPPNPCIVAVVICVALFLWGPLGPWFISVQR